MTAYTKMSSPHKDQGWHGMASSTIFCHQATTAIAIFWVRLVIFAAITLCAAFMKIKPSEIQYHVNWQIIINVLEETDCLLLQGSSLGQHSQFHSSKLMLYSFVKISYILIGVQNNPSSKITWQTKKKTNILHKGMLELCYIYKCL